MRHLCVVDSLTGSRLQTCPHWMAGGLETCLGRDFPVSCPARCRPSLGELLRLQPALLRQLSHVKLRILARAYQRVYPDDSKGLSEDDLYARMLAAIQVCPQVLPCCWQS